MKNVNLEAYRTNLCWNSNASYSLNTVTQSLLVNAQVGDLTKQEIGRTSV